MVTYWSLTLGDVLHGKFLSGAKKVDIDSILPIIILPLMLRTASISLTVTIVIMVTIGMGALYVISRPRKKNRSPFFFSWTIASAFCMFIVYQTLVLESYKVTVLENIVLVVLVLCTCFFFYMMKTIADKELTGSSKGQEYSPVLTSDSYYCQICQIEVNERLFHTIWWDCCVFRANYRYFLAGQLFAFVTLLVGTSISLTVTCKPFVLYGKLLLPDQCSHVYDLHSNALIFVTSVYGVGYLLVTAVVLLHQLFVYIPKYCGLQWKYKVVNVLSM